MGKLTIGCFASLVGSLSLDFAVKLADAAVKKGHKVDLWVSGNATMLSKKGQKAFKDYSHLAKTLQELFATGNFQATACEACAEARGYHKEDTMEGWKRHSMDWYLASCFGADRVLHIGGD
ncbi:MAG: DsrE family protein [Thermodesulfovibrionales bacterium]